MSEPGERSAGERRFLWLLSAVFVIMAVELVLLARQNRSLKVVVAALEQQLGVMRSAASLKAGDVLQPLELPTLSGESMRLAYNDPVRDTILLVFSPDCPACAENLESWSRLQAAHDPDRESLVYVSSAGAEATQAFASDHGLPGPVLVSGAQSLNGYKVNEIPATIRVGPGGVVKRVWVGVLSEEALRLFAGGGS